MQVILKEDISGLGHKNDIITVKDGYGRNYLIPKKFAIEATPSSIKVINENIRQQKHKEAKVRNSALELAEQLKSKKLRIGAKTSTTGKIFGSVNTIQVAEAINKKGFEIDRKNITIHSEDSIKEVGTYSATIKIFKDIKVDIEFEVFSE